MSANKLCPAYILAGGQSRRFGSDKARHVIDGQPQLLRMREWLKSAGHAVYVVADHAQRFIDLGITALVDERAQAGPLAGLATALAHHQERYSLEYCVDEPVKSTAGAEGWLLLTSCDQSCWQAEWYSQMIQHAHQMQQAVCYFDQHWHPLPGLYHTSLLDSVRGRLAHNQLSLQGLLDAVNAYRLLTVQPPSCYSFNSLTDL